MSVINGTIDRFEDDKAVIRLSDGQQIIWPKSHLENNIQVGDSVSFTLSSANQSTLDNQQQAKDILNQILNNKND